MSELGDRGHPDGIASAARSEFIGAIGATKRAWYQTNLLAMSRRSVMRNTREVMLRGEVDEIVALLTDIAGPVAPVDPREALGVKTHQHGQLAGLLARLAVRRAVNARATLGRPAGEDLPGEIARVIDDLACWVESGMLVGGASAVDAEAAQARQISALVERSADAADVHAARVRLALVAPLAPPLESLRIMSSLDASFVQHAPDAVDEGAARERNARRGEV